MKLPRDRLSMEVTSTYVCSFVREEDRNREKCRFLIFLVVSFFFGLDLFEDWEAPNDDTRLEGVVMTSLVERTPEILF
jgi:hypothetical protein